MIEGQGNIVGQPEPSVDIMSNGSVDLCEQLTRDRLEDQLIK